MRFFSCGQLGKQSEIFQDTNTPSSHINNVTRNQTFQNTCLVSSSYIIITHITYANQNEQQTQQKEGLIIHNLYQVAIIVSH